MIDADVTGGLRRSPILLVLGVALVLSGALAVQAIVAMRSQHRVTEGAMRDYASIASWELHRELEARLYPTLQAAAFEAGVRSRSTTDAAQPSDLTAAVERFAVAARRRLAGCGCDDALEDFFVLDLDRTRLHSVAPHDAGTDSLIAARVVAALTGRVTAHGGAGSSGGELVVTRGGRRTQTMTQGLPSGAIAMDAGDDRAVVYTIVGSAPGGPRLAHGLVVRRGAYVAAVTRDILAQRALLPATLTRGASNTDVVEVAVSDTAGRLLSGALPAPRAGVVHDTVRTELGSFVTALAIRDGVADRLIIGGVPRSRLPLLLATLLVTLLTFAFGMHQVRRQHALHRMRDSFISGVSHELRTPLAQIRLFSELLESEALAEPQRRRAIETIGREAKRLAYLVENVLRFSRSGSPAAAPRKERTDLRRLLHDVTDAFRPLAESRGVELAVMLPDAMEANVDPDSVSQVVLNLLDNAMKYGPKRQRIAVGAATHDAEVRVWVDDEGPGVPPESRDSVWQPYVRLAQHERSATGGSGIGLAIVRQIVEAHGGTCRVEAAPSGGARFVFTLPRATTDQPSAA